MLQNASPNANPFDMGGSNTTVQSPGMSNQFYAQQQQPQNIQGQSPMMPPPPPPPPPQQQQQQHFMQQQYIQQQPHILLYATDVTTRHTDAISF